MDRRVGVVVVVKITLEVWEGLSCVHPHVRSMSLARGTPTNFLGDGSFAMKYVQRSLKYCEKRSSQPGSLKDLDYMEFVLVKSKMENFALYEEFLVK
jgi:hypothetical protein